MFVLHSKCFFMDGPAGTGKTFGMKENYAQNNIENITTLKHFA